MTDDTAPGPQTGPAPAPFAPPLGEPSAAYPPPTAAADPYPGLPPRRPPMNPLAVAALVCGLLGLAPAAIVLGHIGFAQAQRSGQRGRGLAVAGFVLGYLAIVLAVIAYLAWTAFVGDLRDGGYLPA
ncbi:MULTISPECIES: DUF4190 domain-containing protein [unclassified Rathayibacter]|uniref:DUF4190 domain-containing protein n=1 Tax=unclassified Rathayibacter TaxID=2609250 RepID=UPI000CE8F6AF|nr:MULTISPECIES: DUF4190 domain-containing protein [unclassified Rathayibacter]PPH12898.1 hypothetical protein C5C35_16335 [Rathayibacter sp. AY1F8]PPH71057.1 hypothetical protein C5C90_15425 [Rathayibacter sp. AY1D4]